MVQRSVITLYSDLSGIEINTSSADIQFGLDGATYEIDLTADEAEELRAMLAPYIAAGRKVSQIVAGPRDAPLPNNRPSSKQLRAWGIENGFEVPARGRVPALVQEAYDAAQS